VLPCHPGHRRALLLLASLARLTLHRVLGAPAVTATPIAVAAATSRLAQAADPRRCDGLRELAVVRPNHRSVWGLLLLLLLKQDSMLNQLLQLQLLL
jgi:hypothetical protein